MNPVRRVSRRAHPPLTKRSRSGIRPSRGLALLATAVLAGAGLTGCSEEGPDISTTAAGTPTTPATSTAAPSSSEAPATSVPAETDTLYEAQLSGGAISPTPATIEIAVGETLTMRFSSDVATQIHAHGFEVEQDVPAGQSVTVALSADVAGVYEVETHDPSLLIMQVQVG